MTQSIDRPLCVKCGKMFTDEDVKAENYKPVSFNIEKGPSFIHNTCQTENCVC